MFDYNGVIQYKRTANSVGTSRTTTQTILTYDGDAAFLKVNPDEPIKITQILKNEF